MSVCGVVRVAPLWRQGRLGWLFHNLGHELAAGRGVRKSHTKSAHHSVSATYVITEGILFPRLRKARSLGPPTLTCLKPTLTCLKAPSLMREHIANIVHPVIAHGLELQQRLRERLPIEHEQTLLKDLLLSDFESLRWSDFGGDVADG